MLRVRIVSLLAVATLSLGACSGGHSTSPVPSLVSGEGPSGVTPSFEAKNFFYDTKTLQKSQYVGGANFGAFGFDVVLNMRGASGLVQYASEVSNPISGSYRHFLTPQEIGQRYGAPASTVAAATRYFTSFGLGVTTWPQNMMMHVAGRQRALEAAFNTKFGVYKLGTDTVIGPITAPSLPASIGVAGSPNIVVWPSRFLKPNVKGASQLSNAVTGYSPQQVAAGFNYTGAYAAGYRGTGISIGVIGTGPIAISGVDGITLGDVDATERLFGVSRANEIALVPVGDTAGGKAFSAGGFTAPLPVNNGSGCAPGGLNPNDGLAGSDSPTTTCNPEDGETQIDTEQTALLAPGANIEYYLAYNPNDGCGAVAPATCPTPPSQNAGIPEQGLFESDAEIQQAIADNTADVLSLSFGESEFNVQQAPNVTSTLTFESFETSEFAALASEGIATFVSSGDTGAETCQRTGPAANINSLCVTYPASDPNVVAVGGVTIPLNGAGQLVGPIAAWGVQTFGGVAGSGGGLSVLFGLPAFQDGVDYFLPSGDAALGVRGVPDVSLLGDPETGIAVITDADPTLGGFATQTLIFGGTSVAAPQMAAMWALVLQACAQTAACVSKGSGPHPYRLGDPNPLFYGIYGKGTGAQYPSTFDNVVYGSNQQLCQNNGVASPCPTGSPSLLPGYSAGPGYNLVTGIGAPFARALIKAVVGV